MYECRARGIFRLEKRKPLVGDNVEMAVIDGEEKTGNLEELLADHVSYRLDSFSTYLPAEAEKLRHAILTREGRTVILCVCGDYEAAQAVLDER